KEAGIPALAGFDGVMWLRQRITLTATQAAAANSLLLGTIDTFDTCWVNGQRVGSGTANWATRDYPLPAGTLHAGANEIVLRVLGGGGLTGDPQARGIKTGDGTLIPLDRAWRYQLGARATGLSVAPAPWDVPNSLTTLYNGMIAPIAGYGYTLAAWYQGESNTAAARDYATLLPMMMADWRRAAGQPTLPFLIVQLAAYGLPRSEPGESDWATLRDIQAKVARADAHAALATALDVGDRFDIHPSQKSVVGERLARAARARAYGEPIAAGGPEALAVTRGTNTLAIRFRDAGAGLRTYGADVAIGFEACDATRCRYVPGKAAGDVVTLAVDDAAAVTRVRYAWADAPPVNLYSSDDLPAVPFELKVDAP
ncbi:sialate O-acetylesterase, partial [Sphingomonas sp. GC_Shp_4]